MARRAKGPDGNGGSAGNGRQEDETKLRSTGGGGRDWEGSWKGISEGTIPGSAKGDPYNVRAEDVTAEMIAGADRSTVQVYRETLHDRLVWLFKEAGGLCEPGAPDPARVRWKDKDLAAIEGGALVLDEIMRVRKLTAQCREALQPPEPKRKGAGRRRRGGNSARASEEQGLEKLAGIVDIDVGRDKDMERQVLGEEVFRGRVGMENED